jgi:hypothetical protein
MCKRGGKMKKWCVLVMALLLVPVLCFGAERVTKKGEVQAKGFGDNEISFEQAHVCRIDSANCDVPEKLITSTPVLHMVIYLPQSQGYRRYYLVSDSAGTLVSFFTNHTSLDAGFQTLELEQALPAGDYVFTGIVEGDNGIAAIGDQYRFTVR